MKFSYEEAQDIKRLLIAFEEEQKTCILDFQKNVLVVAQKTNYAKLIKALSGMMAIYNFEICDRLHNDLIERWGEGESLKRFTEDDMEIGDEVEDIVDYLQQTLEELFTEKRNLFSEYNYSDVAAAGDDSIEQVLNYIENLKKTIDGISYKYVEQFESEENYLYQLFLPYVEAISKSFDSFVEEGKKQFLNLKESFLDAMRLQRDKTSARTEEAMDENPFEDLDIYFGANTFERTNTVGKEFKKNSIPIPEQIKLENYPQVFFATEPEAKNTQTVLDYMNSKTVTDSNVVASYSDFKSLSTDEQIEKFANMSSKAIYDMVKNSPESWPVEGYDKVTPENAKDFIVLNADTSFNLDWPKYGGYDPKTISSISDLSGKVEVSRDGGDGGYNMGIGRNIDGSYDNNSMRSIPKSSAEVNTGTFDVDKYKESVDIVSSDATDEEKTARLMDMGFDEDSADDMLKDYESWKSRPEIIGDGNIEQGAKMANPDGQIDMKYGVHGKAAEWDIGGVHMEGGAGQMNTVYSWGTCRSAGIITNCGKAKID